MRVRADGEGDGELSPSPGGGGWRWGGVITWGTGIEEVAWGVAEVRFGGWGSDSFDDVEDTMKKGMNPEAVEQMGTTAETSGEDVNTIYTTVQGRVTDFDWTGEDRDK